MKEAFIYTFSAMLKLCQGSGGVVLTTVVLVEMRNVVSAIAEIVFGY